MRIAGGLFAPLLHKNPALWFSSVGFSCGSRPGFGEFKTSKFVTGEPWSDALKPAWSASLITVSTLCVKSKWWEIHQRFLQRKAYCFVDMPRQTRWNRENAALWVPPFYGSLEFLRGTVTSVFVAEYSHISAPDWHPDLTQPQQSQAWSLRSLSKTSGAIWQAEHNLPGLGELMMLGDLNVRMCHIIFCWRHGAISVPLLHNSQHDFCLPITNGWSFVRLVLDTSHAFAAETARQTGHSHSRPSVGFPEGDGHRRQTPLSDYICSVSMFSKPCNRTAELERVGPQEHKRKILFDCVFAEWCSGSFCPPNTSPNIWSVGL